MKTDRKQQGFSLIEVAFAIAIVGLIATASLGVMSEAMLTTRDAADDTLEGLILEDVKERVRGNSFTEGPLGISPVFYDADGRFVSPDSEREKFYRVELQLVKPHAIQHAPDLLALVFEVKWPVDPVSGETIPAAGGISSETHTVMVSKRTGPDWEIIDSDFVPEIGY